MRPTALITCNQSPDYLACLPLIVRSWNLQGFNVELAITDPWTPQAHLVEEMIRGMEVQVYLDMGDGTISKQNPALYTQCLRLYMPRELPSEQYAIVGDADMFIGSSFLHRDFDKLNVFGWDLTGHGQVPMCYVGMKAERWREVMKYELRGFEYDLHVYAEPGSGDWYKAWGADQDILTGKLKEYGQGHWNQIPRTTDPHNSGLPLGRWDRHNLVRPSSEIHDIHLPRDPLGKPELLIEMARACYPNENWGWIWEYSEKFKACG
jgi:hypothetical protein